jgi:hypothetical protein
MLVTVVVSVSVSVVIVSVIVTATVSIFGSLTHRFGVGRAVVLSSSGNAAEKERGHTGIPH